MIRITWLYYIQRLSYQSAIHQGPHDEWNALLHNSGNQKLKPKYQQFWYLRVLWGIFPPYCLYNFWCCSIIMAIPCLNLLPYSHCFWYLIINFYQILSKVSDIKDKRWSNAGISSSVWRHMYYINSSVWR